MRKRIALSAVVILSLGIAASTLATAGTRSSSATRGDRSATVTATDSSRGGPVTVVRLLQARLEVSRRLALALRFLDQPTQPKNGTHTIIDEPDPAGYGDGKNPESGDPEEGPPPGSDSTDDGNDPPSAVQATK